MGTFGGKRLTAGTGGVVLAGFLVRGGTAVMKYIRFISESVWIAVIQLHIEHDLEYLANCLHLDTYFFKLVYICLKIYVTPNCRHIQDTNY